MAHALDGLSRAEAARLVGLERQALRDAVVRYNAEGMDRLRDRPKSGRPTTLGDAEQAVLMATILREPDPSATAGRSGRCRCCAAGSRSASVSTCTRTACRAWCESWTCRERRPGRGTRVRMKVPR
ncbi:helix-turn-helix domain containing protein [Roseomonas sp. SSH11]|uniref:Helix-turn-helix domain containing protein n=1 Tax=Pararoseomonas baculiformis TaxID=2820812 RepID=A0ABS4AEI1_9PROT|nr:helix-turn-helix domain containing protein [Pararoseomonas baculiformis]